MARGAGQKGKLLALERIFWEQTDEAHPLSIPRLMALLQERGVDCRDRKSLYDDLETLRLFGLDIESRREGRGTGYYLASRQFELPELKLLVDAAQSSRFITREKTGRLIRKLESLTSVFQARQLQRQVYVTGRVKAENERVYYTVDALHAAIDEGSRVRFHYFEWVLGKNGRLERRLRRAGEWYEASPWALIWDNENYYLVAYDHRSAALRHYRVDKLLDLQATGQPREGAELWAGRDPAAYAAAMFGMFGGQQERLQLLVEQTLIGVIADRFGRDCIVAPYDRDHVTVHVQAAVSPQFFSWVFSLEGRCRILAPAAVAEQYRAMLENGIRQEEYK